MIDIRAKRDTRNDRPFIATAGKRKARKYYAAATAHVWDGLRDDAHAIAERIRQCGTIGDWSFDSAATVAASFGVGDVGPLSGCAAVKSAHTTAKRDNESLQYQLQSSYDVMQAKRREEQRLQAEVAWANAAPQVVVEPVADGEPVQLGKAVVDLFTSGRTDINAWCADGIAYIGDKVFSVAVGASDEMVTQSYLASLLRASLEPWILGTAVVFVPPAVERMVS